MSYAQITLVGNVGNDPELRYTPAGLAVCNFSLAVNRKRGKGDERKEETTWWRVAVWGNTAETVNQYVTKGKQILVEGSRVSANAYVNKAGEPAASLELTADRVIFLGGSNSGGGYQPSDEDYPGSDSKVDDIPF